MSANDLESLTITRIRGFVEPFTLTFDKDRKLCIVYGENGTGKSTLCDALDLLGSHSDHGWPRNNKSGSYWSSAKDARRLHPLQRPQ